MLKAVATKNKCPFKGLRQKLPFEPMHYLKYMAFAKKYLQVRLWELFSLIQVFKKIIIMFISKIYKSIEVYLLNNFVDL